MKPALGKHANVSLAAAPWFLCALVLVAGCAGGQRSAPEIEPDATEQLAAEGDSLRRMARVEPREPFWPCRLAERLAAADSLPSAARALAAALAIDPLYAPAVSLRSKLYFEAGDFEAGARLLEGALAAGCQPRAPLQAALALHLDAQGELDRAAELVAELGSSAGAAAVTGPALGYLVLRSEHPFGADSLLAAAAAAAPGSAAALNNRGIGLLYAGQPGAAQADFERALELDPGCAGAHYNLAIVHLNYRFDSQRASEHFAAFRRLEADGADPDELGRLLAGSPAAGPVAMHGEKTDAR